MLKYWIPLWIVPVLLIFATGTVWLRLSIVRTTYAINQADRGIRLARQEKELFQLKMAALRSPSKLEILARTKFGLSQPRTDQIIYLNKSEIVRHGP
jgi:hypothetical protein